MTHKTILTTVIIALTCLTLWTCKKDKIVCTDEEAFCAFVDDQNFDNTGPIIDGFLQTLDNTYDPADFYNGHEKNLELLMDWLECKSCVKNVKMYVGIVKTSPLQKEYGIDFKVDGQTVHKTLDILLAEEPQFRGYH